jgi:hypothetical protein
MPITTDEVVLERMYSDRCNLIAGAWSPSLIPSIFSPSTMHYYMSSLPAEKENADIFREGGLVQLL